MSVFRCLSGDFNPGHGALTLSQSHLIIQAVFCD